MVCSAIFLLDDKGKIIIWRNYRGDVPKSAVDKCAGRRARARTRARARGGCRRSVALGRVRGGAAPGVPVCMWGVGGCGGRGWW